MSIRSLFLRLVHLIVACAWLIVPTRSALAQTPSAPVTPAPAPSTPVLPPIPNRLNMVLPPWLRVRGEFRERMEGVDNAGYVSGRDDLFWLSRFRFSAAVTPSKALSFQVQLQDARVAEKEIGATGSPFTAALDLRMGFADVGATSGPVTVRLGRQELAFGEQRLVGHGNWTNAARTFDGVRVTTRGKKATLDLFAASVVRIMASEFDKSGNGNRFFGGYATTGAIVPKGSVEPYFFWRGDRAVVMETGGRGTLQSATAGVRWIGRLPVNFEYGVEAALQRGSVGTDDINAWAGHFQVRTPAFGPALRLTSEYNMASGDRNATDGTRGTFDQLYPTAHDKYGLADQVGWKNIRHFRTGVEIARIKGLPIATNYHAFWLDDTHDGLYLANGLQLVRVPGGAVSSYVGQEIDLQASRAITPQLTVSAGYAYIRPGAFLKAATPGASYSTPFVMATYVFLADK